VLHLPRQGDGGRGGDGRELLPPAPGKTEAGFVLTCQSRPKTPAVAVGLRRGLRPRPGCAARPCGRFHCPRRGGTRRTARHAPMIGSPMPRRGAVRRSRPLRPAHRASPVWTRRGAMPTRTGNPSCSVPPAAAWSRPPRLVSGAQRRPCGSNHRRPATLL
jgi:hypothetical protein